MRSQIGAASLYKSAHRFATYIVLGKHLFPPWSASGHGSKAPFNSRYDNSTISALQQRSFHMAKGKKTEENQGWKILWSNKQAFFKEEDKSVHTVLGRLLG